MQKMREIHTHKKKRQHNEGTAAMSPSQKDDDGQEWKKVRRVSDHYVRPWDLWFGNRPVAVRLSEADIDAILADHHDAQQLRERVRVLEEALRKRGKCFHCQGTGKPNCVTCDDYQACRCRPGEGRYAERCWNCKGTGLNAWAAALLSPAAATKGGEGA